MIHPIVRDYTSWNPPTLVNGDFQGFVQVGQSDEISLSSSEQTYYKTSVGLGDSNISLAVGPLAISGSFEIDFPDLPAVVPYQVISNGPQRFQFLFDEDPSESTLELTFVVVFAVYATGDLELVDGG
jgi:hypothetical protein